MRELERDFPDGGRPSAGVEALPAIAVIGAGRAGTAIAAAAERTGLRVALAGRDAAASACNDAEAALLCVPDGAIEAAAQAAADSVPPLRFVGHTSGAVGLEALAAAAAKGATTFGLHPLQTIPEGATELSGAACAVSGSTEEALALATRLATALGMRPFEIADADRAIYHAAASMASNFLVALEESAAAALAAAGIDDPRELLAPLVLRSAANWAKRGAGALTGPIARGDEATVERHRAALAESAPDLLPLYDALAARTRELARETVA